MRLYHLISSRSGALQISYTIINIIDIFIISSIITTILLLLSWAPSYKAFISIVTWSVSSILPFYGSKKHTLFLMFHILISQTSTSAQAPPAKMEVTVWMESTDTSASALLDSTDSTARTVSLIFSFAPASFIELFFVVWTES